MKKTIGIILNNPDLSLGELTYVRSAITLPFGGRYRLVDFALSNLVNSKIRKIGVFASNKYRSLIDHLGTGQEWSLSRKSQDLMILQGGIPSYLGRSHCAVNLEDFHDNMGFFTHSSSENVVICASNLVCNLDVSKILEYHESKDADVTLVTQKRLGHMESLPDDVGVEADESGRVLSLSMGNSKNLGRIYLSIMVIRTSLLMRAIQQAMTTHSYDLVDILARLTKSLQIYSYDYAGYIRRIYSLQSYYQASMDLLNPSVVQRLFMSERDIFTKIKDNPPTQYGPSAQVTNSFIASGCDIEGEVNSSILFRESDVGPGSVVKGCIIMESCQIGRDVILENVILDRSVTISDQVVLQGTPGNPVAVRKGTSI